VRILGIDPGYAITGWSIVEKDFTLVGYGVIETSRDDLFADRLYSVHTGLCRIIEEYAPGYAAVEKLFFSRNTTTALSVAQAIGSIILTLRIHDVPYREYTPVQVKQAITGYGQASKEQMQMMIKRLYRIQEVPRPDDAADALAIATCHFLSDNTRIPL
jgi:crossover junction endodeoxyribonuclease RuvC